MKLLIVGLLALAARADVVSYSNTVSSTVPAGYHIDFSGSPNIPQFDAALGTLTSVHYMMGIDGLLGWTMQRKSPDATESVGDINVTDYINLTALGLEANWSQIFNLGKVNCGQPPNPCFLQFSNLSVGGMYIQGDITDSTATVSIWGTQSRGVNGTPPAGLAGLIGTSSLSMPVLASIDLTPAGPAQLFTSNTINLFSRITYTYTPAMAAETPEPRWIALLALLIPLSIGLRKHIRALPPERPRAL